MSFSSPLRPVAGWILHGHQCRLLINSVECQREKPLGKSGGMLSPLDEMLVYYILTNPPS